MTKMTFRKMFPERATVGEDGVCRWSCEVDMKKDRHTRELARKVSLIVSGSMLLLMLGAMWYAGDFRFAWIPLLMCAAILPIIQLSFLLYRKMLGDRMLIAYEMYNDSIVMIRSPKEEKVMQGLAVATGVLGILSGHPLTGACRAAGAFGASQPVATKFHRIRKLCCHADSSMIDLRAPFTMAQVWTHPDDYYMILDFMRERADLAVETC